MHVLTALSGAFAAAAVGFVLLLVAGRDEARPTTGRDIDHD